MSRENPKRKEKDRLTMINTYGKILELYSEWLEKHGYMDSDWRSEHPTAIDEFFKEITE